VVLGGCANNRLQPIVRTICQVDVSSMWQHCFCCWWFGISVVESVVSSFVLDRVVFILTGIFHDHYRELVPLIHLSGNPGLETGCNALFLASSLPNKHAATEMLFPIDMDMSYARMVRTASLTSYPVRCKILHQRTPSLS
jgi:hypothetical protein